MGSTRKLLFLYWFVRLMAVCTNPSKYYHNKFDTQYIFSRFIQKVTISHGGGGVKDFSESEGHDIMAIQASFVGRGSLNDKNKKDKEKNTSSNRQGENLFITLNFTLQCCKTFYLTLPSIAVTCF